jgi:hypothetical protein
VTGRTGSVQSAERGGDLETAMRCAPNDRVEIGAGSVIATREHESCGADFGDLGDDRPAP